MMVQQHIQDLNNCALGSIVVFLEIFVLRKHPEDLHSPARLKDRIFGKIWLKLGTSIFTALALSLR